MRKYNFKVDSFLYYIAGLLLCLVFCYDFIACIITIIDMFPYRIDAVLITGTIFELLIVTSISIILIIFFDFKFKKSRGALNLKPFVNLAIASVYLILFSGLLFSMIHLGAVAGEIILLMIFLLALIGVNVATFFVSRTLNVLGNKIFNIIVDSLNLVMTIVLFAITYYSNLTGIIIGIFSLISISILLICDIINLVNPCILKTSLTIGSKGTYQIKRIKQVKAEVKEEKNEETITESESSKVEKENESQ